MRRRSLLHMLMLALVVPLRTTAQTLSPNLTVTADDLLKTPTGLQLRMGRALPATPRGLPPINPADHSAEAGMLRRAVAQGRAAGTAGVVYDNRDRGHSALPENMFPPMTRLAYAPDLVAQGLDYGLALPILLPAPQGFTPVIGNSSTAITAGAAPRSLPRLAMTAPGGPDRAWAGYAANQIWVYPEHRDHDAVDLFPANWPYMLISQGSSRSDRPLLRAAGLILGALPPATRRAAQAQGLIGPTVQMLFRRGQVRGTQGYLTGNAHPTVFDGTALPAGAMVAQAAGLTPGNLPPLLRLAVLTEDFAAAAGLDGLSERLFDTPSAVARIWRGPAFRRQMVVSTALTEGKGAVTRWHWVLLRGDPGRVRIMPQPGGDTARIRIDWHDTAALGAGRAADLARTGGRLDIGVFAETAGGQISAPAFISVSFPLHEARDHAPGPDGQMRLRSVDYDAVGRNQAFDPLLHWSAPWRDTMIWGADGSLAGWRRTATTPEGMAAAGNYDAAGHRGGRPVRYRRGGSPRQPVLQPVV